MSIHGFAVKVHEPGPGAYVATLSDGEGNDVCSVRVVKVMVTAGGGSIIELWETHCTPGLAPGLQGQGLGLMAYAEAIRFGLSKGRTVTSSYAPSVLAQRVWRSKRLRLSYDVVWIGKRWWVCGPAKKSDAG